MERFSHKTEAVAKQSGKRDEVVERLLTAWRREILAGIVSIVAHFAVGAAKSLFTLRSWWASGLEMTLAGVIVGGLTYAVGLAFA